MYKTSYLNYKVNETEYAYNTNVVSYAPGSMQVHIPKLMPQIVRNPSATNKVSINQSIFCNDPVNCPVKCSPVLTIQNFITVTPHPNRSISFPTKKDGNGRLQIGNKFLVEIMNGDIRQIYLSNKM